MGYILKLVFPPCLNLTPKRKGKKEWTKRFVFHLMYYIKWKTREGRWGKTTHSYNNYLFFGCFLNTFFKSVAFIFWPIGGSILCGGNFLNRIGKNMRPLLYNNYPHNILDGTLWWSFWGVMKQNSVDFHFETIWILVSQIKEDTDLHLQRLNPRHNWLRV